MLSASITIKFINSSHYHLWNDALHARSLANKTKDTWYRGTYVRWAVTTAWTVLEMCCRDALDDEKIGNRFKDDINTAIENKGLSPVDWSSGIWQKVLDLKDLRRQYTHINISQDELMPEVEVANKAIIVVRKAAKEIYKISETEIPNWLEDDDNEGWR